LFPNSAIGISLHSHNKNEIKKEIIVKLVWFFHLYVVY